MELMLLVQLWTGFYGRTEAYRSQLTATLTEVRECTDPIADSYVIPHVWSNRVDSMAISDAWKITQLTAMNSNLWQTRAPNSYSVWSWSGPYGKKLWS